MVEVDIEATAKGITEVFHENKIPIAFMPLVFERVKEIAEGTIVCSVKEEKEMGEEKRIDALQMVDAFKAATLAQLQRAQKESVEGEILNACRNNIVLMLKNKELFAMDVVGELAD